VKSTHELSFLQVMAHLRDERIRKVVASFREPRVALSRLLVLIISVPYLALSTRTPNPEVAAQSQNGLYVALALLPVAIGWWLYVRKKTDDPSLRNDTIGIVLDALIAFALL